MKFKYKIQNKDREVVEGYAEATDKFALARELRSKGNNPISINEFKINNTTSFLKLDFLFSNISLAEKIIFTNNLSGMLSAGLSLARALTVLEKQSNNLYFKKIMQSLMEEINKGNTLSDGMKKFPKVFSGIFISMVHSGEESGGLPRALSEVGTNLKKSYDLNKKIKGALIYPSIIVGAIFLIGVLMLIFVVPTLTKTFNDMGVDLPMSTRFIIWLSDSISQHVFIFIGIIISIAGLGYIAFKFEITRRYFDFLTIRIPVIGEIIKEMNSARTARTLSSLLSSGVDMSKALSITEEVLQNFYYKDLIKNSIISVEKGMALSDSFKENSHLYPVMVGEMIEVGEETGNLSTMLLDIATFYEAEVDNKTKDLSTIVEPVLMVFIGGAVGFFAISMISPIYSVMDNIK